MIPAVHPRGTDVGGLLRYLFGPGKREEHRDPHLVAAWTGADPLPELEPPVGLRGGRDVRRLEDMLNQPVRVARNPPELTVWHTSIRLHPTDRVLSDQQWGHIAAEVMAAVGLAPNGDHRAVRWVAVRHAEDHIHLVATLVRQDRRTAWGWKDKLKAQRACRDLEERYNLYLVAPPGKGTRTWPSPAELNKTTRLHCASTSRTATAGWGRSRRGPVPPREEMRRRVRAVAVAATNEAGFFTNLEQDGIKVRLRHSQRNPQQVTGYAVGLDGHTNPDGEIIFYGGGKLAADLSLPKLRARWSDPTAAEPTSPLSQPVSPGRRAAAASFPPTGVYARAERITREAATALRATSDPAWAAGIARAAADVLTATAKRWEADRGGPLTEAAEVFDRAAHDQRVTATRSNVHATRMRSAARLILLNAAMSRDDDSSATTRLLLTLAVILDGLAAIREAQQLHHQAETARNAARLLRSWKPPAGQTSNQPATSTAPHQQPKFAVPQETKQHHRTR